MIKPNEVKAAAQRVEDENYEFRTFLKCNAEPDELDEQFAALHKELFADYDCCKCANCCKSLGILLDEDDIEKMADAIKSKSDFIDLYLTKADPDDEKPYKFKESPCTFLDDDDGHCWTYDCKPKDCEFFPFTDQPDRLQSLYSIIGHAEVCPIVFEILERLKAEYKFHKSIRS
jgi:hypothetical protein